MVRVDKTFKSVDACACVCLDWKENHFETTQNMLYIVVTVFFFSLENGSEKVRNQKPNAKADTDRNSITCSALQTNKTKKKVKSFRKK